MQNSRFHVLASFAVLAGVSVSWSSAHAASSTTCTGSSALGYSPGLTFTSQTVTFSEADTFSSCTSTDTSLTSGSYSGTFTVAGVSCNNAAASGPTGGGGGYTISWNNGQSSTFTGLAATVAIIGGNQVFTAVGTVSSGEFTGDDVTITWIYPLLNPLQCATSQGVTSQSGTVTVKIVGQ